MTNLPGSQAPSDLEHRRAYECRLTTDRALKSLDESAAFLADRGLLTRTPDCSLPSLFEACHEEPYRQGGHGFASWPKTKYSWAGELAELPGITVLKIHAGKSLFLTRDTLAIVDPICRAELTRLDGGDRETRRLLGHLASGGPSTLGTLQEELGLRPRELKAIRYPLESCGAIVSRQVVLPADEQPGHLHSSELARYDQIVPEPLSDQDIPRALEEIIIAGVRAAVIAQERELRRWFSWKWYFPPDLVERLVDTHRLSRVAADRVALGRQEQLS
jgi:hypothetical protein